MTITIITPAFNTAADMALHFSQEGVDAFSDHAQLAALEDVVSQCINWAHGEIMNRARNFYTAANLATSTTINEWGTILSCFRLCQKRGNGAPESMQQDVLEIRALLKEMQEGNYVLDAVDPAYDRRPAVANQEVVRAYSWRKLRVAPNSSDRGPLNPAIQEDKIAYPYLYE